MIQILFGPLGFRYQDITFEILNYPYRGITSLGGKLIFEESIYSFKIGPRSGNSLKFPTYILGASTAFTQDPPLERMRRLIWTSLIIQQRLLMIKRALLTDHQIDWTTKCLS